MNGTTRNMLLAGVSFAALSMGSAKAQLVTFGAGTITAPTATTGVSIGLLANQINDALNGSAVVSGGTGVTATPGATSAADATTSVTSNAITATMAGNVAAPATGQLYTVNAAGMDSAGAGRAASSIFQLNSAPNVLAGVGVDATGTATLGSETVGANFATTLTSTADVTGNAIGSTAVGNQTNNIVGGATPGAGVAGGSASVNVIGALQQRSNTLDYNNQVSADATRDFTVLGAQAATGAGVAAAGTLIYVTGLGTGAAASEYYTSSAASPTTGTYATSSDPGGSVSGVIAATSLQRNTGLDTSTQIRAITDGGVVSAVLGAGATGATLDNSVNAVTANATGNQATTGIAVTGGAPAIFGGLAVLSEQVNASAGATAAGAGISALNNAGQVITDLSAAGSSVGASSLLMEGNQLSAGATGSSATNMLTASALVRLNAAAAPTLGNGAGGISTGALLSQERTIYTESVGTTSTLETSAYTTVTADSSGVAPFAAAGAVADYLAVNIQRNSGTGTTPLAITAATTAGDITLRTSVATTTGTATGSTLALSENSISASATGARATTQIGNGTATMLGDGATLAALSLQEATSTSVRSNVTNSDVTIGLQSTADVVSAGGSVAIASNAITASALSNIATTTLSNIAASGGTLANASFTSGVRTDATGDNLDASYTAPLAAISAQRVTTATGTLPSGAASLAYATVVGSDVLLSLSGAAGTAATGSTLSLTGNSTTATAGANQANVGVSFAAGMGSIIPGGAVAATSQLLAPAEGGTSVTAVITASEMQVIADTAGAVDSITGGSVTASGNRFAAQAVGNQGAASMTGSSLLIAGGAGGAGATATLTSGVDPSVIAPATSASANNLTGQASYLVTNTQRVFPSTGTMTIESGVSDASVSAIAGGSASTFAVANNVVTAIGAANVFNGQMSSLSGSNAATSLALSQQDVSGTRVASSVNFGGAVVSTGNSGLGLDSTTTAASLSGGSVSVASNTFRALAVMNEGTLVVADAGVQDLGVAGGGRIASVTANGGGTAALTLSGVEVGAASQQNVTLNSNAATLPLVPSVASSSVTNVRVGVDGGGAITTTSLGVTGNTVDARTMGNTATVAASGDVFAGGVAVANSQNVTQTGLLAGLSASNANTSVGVGTVALAPPIGTASMEVANNTVSSMAVANEASLQLAALTPGSLGNGSLATRGTVGLSTGTGTTSFVSGLNADYMTANVQTTGGLVANSATTGAEIRAAAAVTGGTVALNSNRITADTVGNRASASTALSALNAGYVQTASLQTNTGGTFGSSVVNGRVSFDASSPSLTVASSVGVSNNAILASTMGNVFSSTQSMVNGGTNYVQTASRQVNTGTSIAASVTGASVLVAGNGGQSTTTVGGNTVGASAMGNVLRSTVGSR